MDIPIDILAKNTGVAMDLFEGVWRTYSRPVFEDWEHSAVGGMKFFNEILSYYQSHMLIEMPDNVTQFLRGVFELKISHGGNDASDCVRGRG